MNDLDPLWLRSFVAIAECGSVTAAARKVHRTQSAVSGHLKQLESSLGAALATRTTRQLALTAEGERLLPVARRLLGLQDEARATVRSQGTARPWRIGLSEYFVPARLSALLGLLRHHTGPAGMEVLWSASAHLEQLWQQGEVDLAVITSTSPRPEARLLRREPLAWVAGAGRPPGPDLSVPLVLLGPGCPVRQIAIDSLQRRGRAHHLQLGCSGAHGAIAALRAGWGVGCLNDAAIPEDLHRLASTDPRGWPSPGRLSFYLHARPELEEAARALARWARPGATAKLDA
jgi:DNA-binding transcriptional LysR family regulator